MTSEERDNEGGVDLLTEPGLCRLQKYCPRLARALSTAAALSRPSAEQRKHVYLPIGERGWVVSLSLYRFSLYLPHCKSEIDEHISSRRLIQLLINGTTIYNVLCIWKMHRFFFFLRFSATFGIWN